MKLCDVTKFIKFYQASDSANRPKTGRNCTRLASFLLLSVFPPWTCSRDPCGRCDTRYNFGQGFFTNQRQKEITLTKTSASIIPRVHSETFLKQFQKWTKVFLHVLSLLREILTFLGIKNVETCLDYKKNLKNLDCSIICDFVHFKAKQHCLLIIIGQFSIQIYS